tara:strand:- start:241 stop:555 length:315 start_codon:yes stop_codon:yes gene_type:complete
MAAGDVFANMAQSTATSITVQPAAGVQACITFISTDSTTAELWGNHAGTLSYAMFMSRSSSTGTKDMRDWQNNNNMKLFITNTDFIVFVSASGTIKVSYSGIEI